MKNIALIITLVSLMVCNSSMAHDGCITNVVLCWNMPVCVDAPVGDYWDFTLRSLYIPVWEENEQCATGGRTSIPDEFPGICTSNNIANNRTYDIGLHKPNGQIDRGPCCGSQAIFTVIVDCGSAVPCCKVGGIVTSVYMDDDAAFQQGIFYWPTSTTACCKSPDECHRVVSGGLNCESLTQPPPGSSAVASKGSVGTRIDPNSGAKSVTVGKATAEETETKTYLESAAEVAEARKQFGNSVNVIVHIGGNPPVFYTVLPDGQTIYHGYRR